MSPMWKHIIRNPEPAACGSSNIVETLGSLPACARVRVESRAMPRLACPSETPMSTQQQDLAAKLGDV